MRLSSTRHPSAKPATSASRLAAMAMSHEGREGISPSDANIGGLLGAASVAAAPAGGPEEGDSSGVGAGALTTGGGGVLLAAAALAAALAAFRAVASSVSSFVLSA